MSTWRVGTVVCSGCGTVLSIKSRSDKMKCYLCDTPVDLTDCPVIEEPDSTKEYDTQGSQD